METTSYESFIEYLARKEVKKWASKNSSFFEDLQNLVHKMVMFEVKYGVKVIYSLENDQIKKGRWTGEKEFINILNDK